MTNEEKQPDDNQPRALAREISETLFRSRTVLVFGEINAALARTVTAELVALAEQSRDPVRVIVNSHGGHVESGDTIHDVIRAIDAEVKMIGTGWVVSAGALVYAAAKAENRVCLPNTRFMLHQPLGGVGGPASDVEIEAAQILRIRERLNRLFSEATGQSLEKVARDTERNFWMSPQEACAYGLVSRVVQRLSES